MGHTVSSQRKIIYEMRQELKDYCRAMKAEDRKIAEDLLVYPLLHIGSISFASSLHAWAFLILSIVVEQEKRRKTDLKGNTSNLFK